MNLQWLYYFDTIAELEHYTKAAEKLHVSQSNLSHAIKELENEVGAELFERKGRNIKLSKYGEIFLPYVRQTLNSLETGVSTLKEYIDPNVGTIVLAGFQSLGQFSTDLMVRYQSETNRLDVQFQYSSEIWNRLADMLHTGEIDLALATRMDGDWVGADFIGMHRLVLLAPKGHSLASENGVQLKDLDGVNFIGFDSTSQIRSQLDRVFRSRNIFPNIAAETQNDQIVYGLVAAGRGVSIVPEPLTGAPYNTVIVPIRDNIPERRIYLQWNRNRYMSPAAKYFRDYIVRSGDVFDQYRKQHNLI